MKNHNLRKLFLTLAISGVAALSADAANVNMLANDVNGPVTSFNGIGQWDDFTAPNPANNYFVTNYFMRTPAGTSPTTYTFGGASLTLQAYVGPGATRSLLYKGGSGDVLIINNFTNEAGSRVDQGSGASAPATIGGNRWTIAGDSTLAADQGSAWTINSPLAGSANFTNLGNGTITYNGTNSAFTGRFVLGGTTAKVILNSLEALPGNPGSATPDQFTLGATSLLQDNVGVNYSNSNGGITMTGNATLRPNTAGSNTVIAVPIAGAFTLTKDGAGTLTLAGVNTFSGGLAFTAGQLNLNSATALGAATATFNINGGATINNTSGGSVTIANNNPIAISASFTFAGANNLNLGAGSVNNGSLTKTITVSTNTLTFGGAFTGAGPVIKAGNGILEMAGASTGIGGGLTVNGGTLRVTGSLSTNTVTVGGSGTLSGTGTIGGNTTVSGNVAPGAAGVGTLAFNTNLTFSSGSATFELSTSAASGNDKVTVANNLTLSSADTIYVSALSGLANLDTSDYVLFQVAGTTTMTTSPALVWQGATPGNYLNYTIAKVGNNVVLKYTTATAPTVSASATPASAIRNQATKITAVVTLGSGAIASVTANLTDIGGSSAASLVLSNANVYTNTFVVGPAVAPGAKTITVTVTDNTVPTPLTGNSVVPFAVIVGNKVWDGGSLVDDNWSSNPNWASDAGPAYSGDSVTFAGSTRLTPNMATNFSVTGVAFDASAGGFNIGTANGSVLTLAAGTGIVNNSANNQILNLPLALASSQTISNGAAGNLALAGPISGAGGLTKTGGGTVTLSGSNSYTGSLIAQAGTVVIDSGTNSVTAFSSVGYNGNDVATLTIKATGAFSSTTDFNVGDSDSANGTLNVQDSAVLSVSALYVGSGFNDGSVAIGTVNQTGGTVIQTNAAIGTFTIGGRNAGSTNAVGVYNLSGGNLIAIAPVRMSGYGSATFNQSGGIFTPASGSGGINLQRFAGPGGTYNLNGGVANLNNIDASVLNTDPTFHSIFNFNGGTLKPTATRANFMPAKLSRANIRNGGAVIDTAGFNVSIEQILSHSDIGGDNATDGGVTKLGAGTLTLVGGNSYNGPTFIGGGTLAFDSSSLPYGSGPLTVSNATASVVATNFGTVYPSAIVFKGSSVLNISYGTLFANPSSPALASLAGLTNSGTVTINISASGLTTGQFPLISYSGASVPTNNFVLGPLPAGINAVLTNNAGASLDLLITSAGQQLAWYGFDGVNLLTNWNIDTSANWIDLGSFINAPYREYGSQGDNVKFTDSIYAADATNVNLTTTVKPATMSVEAFGIDFTIAGGGSIAGPVKLVKTNAGGLFLATSNSYTGGTIIGGGTLSVTNNNALGNVTNTVTLAGGTLRLNGGVTSAREFSVTADSSLSIATNTTSALSGGMSGTFALTKAGAGTLNLSGTNNAGQFNLDDGIVNLAGVMTAAGTGQRIRVGNNGGNGVLNIPVGATATANHSLVAGSDTGTGTINVNGGTLVHQTGLNIYLGSGSGGATGTLNLNSGTVSNLFGGVIIGEGGTSVGVYTQSGGHAILGGEVRVGQSAAANQFILSGGTATANDLLIAQGSGAGSATLSGGSLTVGQVQVAAGTAPTSTGTGSLTLSGTAVLNVTNNLRVAYAGAATKFGALTNNGGTINITGGDVGLEVCRWDAVYKGHFTSQFAQKHHKRPINIGQNPSFLILTPMIQNRPQWAAKPHFWQPLANAKTMLTVAFLNGH